jgi:hypothetical protein
MTAREPALDSGVAVRSGSSRAEASWLAGLR